MGRGRGELFAGGIWSLSREWVLGGASDKVSVDPREVCQEVGFIQVTFRVVYFVRRRIRVHTNGPMKEIACRPRRG